LLLLLLAWPRATQAATTPRVAIIQCAESYDENWTSSQMSSQALVGLAVLLGVKYETLILDELLEEAPGGFTAAWFSSCLWIDESHHAELVTYLADHLGAGGSVFLDGPLGVFYRGGDGVERFRGMDDLAAVLGVDWGGWRSTEGYDIVTTGSTHPVDQRAGYGFQVALTVDVSSGTDTMFALDPSAEVLLDVTSPSGGISYPFLVVAEPLAGAKVAAIGSYGSFAGIASPFQNTPSGFSDNQVLPYLLETLVWTTASDPAPYAGLQISHAAVTMLGRLDGDWSDVPWATANTLDYLIDLSRETGIATVYGVVSEFADEGDTWPVLADMGPALQALGGSIGSHSATHPMRMSDELGSVGWEAEVAGSFDQIHQALASGGFAPDVYAFINPGNTIRAEDYGEFFDDVEVYLSHGFESFTPYSTGVQGFGLPSGVPARAVINDVVAPDYQWLYSSSWDYTVEEAAAYQALILDYYQDTVGRGVVYNAMWHDYSLGGNAPPEHHPDTPSVLPLFETAREHFWESEVYAPTVAEAVAKLYVSQGTVTTSSHAGNLQVDLDYADVPSSYRAHIAGMGLRIHQQDEPIRRVVIDGLEHLAFSADTIMMPAPSGSSQRVIVEFGSTPDPDYRLLFASKPVSSAIGAGGGVRAALARPGSAMRYCFAGPEESVVLGADEFVRTSSGMVCGHLVSGNAQPQLEIQPFDTGGLDLFVRRATRPLVDAHAIEGGVHLDYLGGAAAAIEFVSPEPPARVDVDGVSVVPATTAEGFAVTLPARSSPGSLQVWFDEPTCEATETTEASCDDGIDNDCDGQADCADSDCDGSCDSTPRVVVLTQISDATVKQTEPPTNFGSDDSIEVDTADVFQYALIKPDHLGDIAPGAKVVSATLVFQIFNPGDVMEVREVLGPWNEVSVTYSTAPMVTQSAHTTVPFDLTGEVSVDVTAIAQRWVDGGAVHGIELFPTGTDGVDIHSSEVASSSLRPTFVVEVIDSGGQCPDQDGDGHPAESCGGDDCDDTDAGSHPGAAEICDDGADNDCDGAADCADGDCAGSCGAARTVVVTSLSDATVRQSQPQTNFGASDTLEVDTADIYQYALLKPNNLGDIAPGAQVVSAALVFHIFNPGDTMEVRQVLGPWSEAAVTWNTSPQVAQSAHATVSWGLTGEVSVDITAIAQGWVDGDAVHGLELFPTGTDGVDIRSSEYAGASARPTFVFEVIDSGGGPCPDPGADEQCGDGIDNDCDGQIDCADSDCSGQPPCTGGGTVVTVVLEGLDDAYVSDQSPTSNFGAASSLEIDTWAARKRAFIKPVNLGGISPGAEVVSAQLLIHIHDAGDAVTLAEPTSSWNESSITWNTAPSSATGLGSLPAGTSGTVALDVTALVQRWVDGAPLRGLVLEPTSSNGVKLRSTESSDAANRPTFVIEVIQ
jgi:hypothetical protein